MIFLANENIPLDSIVLIRSYNHIVLSIKEDFRGISDIAVLKLANQKDAIILTFDKDYGELIFRENFENPPSVIFFRFKGYNAEFAANALLKIIQNPQIQLQGYFTIIEEETVRQRRFK